MMKINKFTVKRILIPIIILVVLGAAFIIVRSTLAAEIMAIDCHGKIVVTKAIDWNNATPYDSKEFTICISGTNGTIYDEFCKHIKSGDVSSDTLTWDPVPAGTYTVYEKDPGLEWSVTGEGDVTISEDGQKVERTITNTIVALDYGDLPASYGLTLLSEDGPRHKLGNLYLGETISPEFNGQPADDANGDKDPDDDGVVPQGDWSDRNNGTLKVNATGPGCLFFWMDYKDRSDVPGSDGTFDADEFLLDNYIIDGDTEVIIPIRDFDVQIDSAAIQGSNAYSRIRLLPRQENGACEYGNGDPLYMLTGDYIDGEVEDYFWLFDANSIRMVSFNANTIDISPYLIVGVVLLILTSLSLLAWKRMRTVGVNA